MNHGTWGYPSSDTNHQMSYNYIYTYIYLLKCLNLNSQYRSINHACNKDVQIIVLPFIFEGIDKSWNMAFVWFLEVGSLWTQVS